MDRGGGSLASGRLASRGAGCARVTVHHGDRDGDRTTGHSAAADGLGDGVADGPVLGLGDVDGVASATRDASAGTLYPPRPSPSAAAMAAAGEGVGRVDALAVVMARLRDARLGSRSATGSDRDRSWAGRRRDGVGTEVQHGLLTVSLHPREVHDLAVEASACVVVEGCPQGGVIARLVCRHVVELVVRLRVGLVVLQDRLVLRRGMRPTGGRWRP